MRAVHQVRHPPHRRTGERLADERKLARARLREAVGDRQDGAVVLGDAPAAVGQPLRLGQVAVLVEDLGQRGHLLVEGQVRRARQRVGHPALAPLLEELVDLRRAGPAEIAEELGGEVPVALGVERLGGRGQLVDVARPAAARPGRDLVAVRQQPVLFEPRQLEPDGRRGQGERVGDAGCVQGSLAFEDVEDGARRVVGNCWSGESAPVVSVVLTAG